MHHDLVEQKRWISDQRFLHALNYCMVLPGPEAQQLATYIGWLMHRTAGGIAAGVLFVLPSFFILLLLGWIYMRFGNTPLISGLFYGIKPAVVAIVLFAAWRIGGRTLKHPLLWGLALLAFLSIAFLHIPFPAIVLGALVIGWAGGRWRPEFFKAGGGHGSKAKHYGPALIDDLTPTPPHALFRWNRFWRVLALGLGLWLVLMGLLWTYAGTHSLPAQMGWFFTKAALLTFGGAYAVLPYVYQGAVEHFQWLTAAQMMDGLALGESTPGPLIMIVTFVGFVGGWTHAAESPLLLAMVGAAVATVFTFLPSFVFILLGGPFIETTHGNLKFTAPLTAISAAVVGVIVSLGVMLGQHVLMPEDQFAWLPALLAGLALAALVRFKVGVVSVIGVCAVVGLIATAL
jgi:chromate transporter